MKKILVILGHPDNDSFCGALAESYINGARSAGAEVKAIKAGDINFDPILHKGYKVIQELEPDLLRAQEQIKWADHIVFVYPTWWGAMPSLLKGFLERIMIPGFAYRFHEKDMFWDKHLKGRSARLIVTMNSPVFIYKLLYGAVGDRLLKNTILGFCGIGPVNTTHIDSVEKMPKEKLVKWIDKIGKLGQALK